MARASVVGGRRRAPIGRWGLGAGPRRLSRARAADTRARARARARRTRSTDAERAFNRWTLRGLLFSFVRFFMYVYFILWLLMG